MPATTRLLPLLVLLSLAAAPPAALSQRDNDVAEEFGGAGTCAERDRSIKRLLDRPHMAARVAGPAADRKDVAYGPQPRQQLDVFLPERRDGAAPVIVMVHGGGWCVGDKAFGAVTANKTAHWLPKGFVFVSVNYRMLPDGAAALEQAADVARGVAFVQKHAGDWGGDARRIVLMGHSAGAHLVSLVNADARLRAQHGVQPVLGTVSLDSGATDVPAQMRKAGPKVQGRYQEAFGRSEDGWTRASPLHRLDATSAPWLGVCSTRRADDPCSQTRDYADRSRALGVKATVLPVDKRHGAINKDLGLPGSYTESVDAFLATLDPLIRTMLAR